MSGRQRVKPRENMPCRVTRQSTSRHRQEMREKEISQGVPSQMESGPDETIMPGVLTEREGNAAIHVPTVQLEKSRAPVKGGQKENIAKFLQVVQKENAVKVVPAELQGNLTAAVQEARTVLSGEFIHKEEDSSNVQSTEEDTACKTPSVEEVAECKIQSVEEVATCVVQSIEEGAVSLTEPTDEDSASFDKHMQEVSFAEMMYNEAAADAEAMEAESSFDPKVEERNESDNIRSRNFSERIKHLNFSSYSSNEFVKKIEATLDLFLYIDAEYICMAALEKYPGDYDILFQCGKAYIDFGHDNQAIVCLTKCVTLKPNVDYVKYIFLGRLLSGKDSIDHYLTACRNMEMEVVLQTAPKNVFDDMCRCYCAMAEVYLKELKSEENSVAICTKYVEDAIRVKETHPLGYQTMAKLLISEGEIVKAKAYLKKSLDLWLGIYMQMQPDVENLQLPDEYPPDMRILSYEERLDTISLLISVRNYEQAEDIIHLLLTEDDQVVELQYYFGLVLYLKGSNFHKYSKDRLEYALIINQMTKTDNDSILVNINQILGELADVSSSEEDNVESS